MKLKKKTPLSKKEIEARRRADALRRLSNGQICEYLDNLYRQGMQAGTNMTRDRDGVYEREAAADIAAIDAFVKWLDTREAIASGTAAPLSAIRWTENSEISNTVHLMVNNIIKTELNAYKDTLKPKTAAPAGEPNA